MRKIQLSENQEVLFSNFLTWACRDKPTSCMELIEQYEVLSNIKNNLTSYIQNGVIKCSKNEAWAIQDYFQLYVHEIYDKRLGEVLFSESKELFILILTQLFKSKHHYSIFIPLHYNGEQVRIIVNPLDSPESYIAHLK